MNPFKVVNAALRATSRRRQLRENTCTYLNELVAEVGEPSPEQTAEAEALVQRIGRDRNRRSG